MPLDSAENENKNSESLWRYFYAARGEAEEAAYREHYRHADIYRCMGICWVSAGLMLALTFRDLFYLTAQPDLLLGLTIRTVTLIIAITNIVLLKNNPTTRQMDISMLVLAISIIMGLLWIHYAQDISAARMVAISTIAIMASTTGLPVYPLLLCLASILLTVGDAVIINTSENVELQESLWIIMVTYIFATIFSCVTSANHHRARYQAYYAQSQIKTLEGILPICSHCKKIRDDEGYYQQLEKYLSIYSGAQFTHGICPDCMATEYEWRGN